MNDTTPQFALTAETASEFDFIIGLDASGSMSKPSKRFVGKTRWEEAQETIYGIAHTLNKIDADGIDIVVFGGSTDWYEGVTADKVEDLFNTRSPNGGTPLAAALTKIVAKQKTSGKNTVAIIFTDGEPDQEPPVEKVIVDAANSLDKDEALTFLFVQIGDDAGAAKFLARLDDNLPAAKFDIVDTVSAAEAETMQPLDLINKAIND
ncbi:VWA domain-containing protein [Novosphingobium rosa]|uniref:VWA domain-containing protein n=1 Tax=Novosphingobium rosa TaxID=76978 RepID=UPI00083405D4|nr:VWA domain-containing protein [Novosphingobium rosa]